MNIFKNYKKTKEKIKMTLKDKQIEALENMIEALEDELKYIKADAVEYPSDEELIEYIEDNIYNPFKEELQS